MQLVRWHILVWGVLCDGIKCVRVCVKGEGAGVTPYIFLSSSIFGSLNPMLDKCRNASPQSNVRVPWPRRGSGLKRRNAQLKKQVRVAELSWKSR
jgi:hypothetical protein